MARYLIEVSHNDDELECTKAIKIFLESGSHLLSNSDWGCKDGIHKAWLITEAESKEEALMIVPTTYRHNTNIILLAKFNEGELAKNTLHKKLI